MESSGSPLNKLEILLLNNGWNDENEKLIKTIGENCTVFRNLHIKKSKFFYNMDKALKVVLLVGGTLLSTESIFGLITNNIVQKIIIFTLTLVSGFNNFLKYQELAEKHTQASKEYLVLHNDIRNTLCMYKKDRMNSVKYIKSLMTQYDHIREVSPEIPETFVEIPLQSTTGTTGATVVPVSVPDTTAEDYNVRQDFKTSNGDLCEDDTIVIDNIKNFNSIVHQKMQYELDRFKYHN